MTPSEIKSYRVKARLTQRQAASVIGVSTNTWARWERGVSKPSYFHELCIGRVGMKELILAPCQEVVDWSREGGRVKITSFEALQRHCNVCETCLVAFGLMVGIGGLTAKRLVTG